MSRRDGFRDRWRVEVIRSARISDSVRVVLIVLAGRMTDAGYVSVPRTELSALIGRSPRRITERIEKAREAGYLDQVRRGRPGRTAEYQAILPGLLLGADGRTKERSSEDHLMVRTAATVLVRTGAPPWTAPHGADGGPTNTRVTKTNRKSNPHQRDDGVEREHDQTQRRSDAEVPPWPPLAAVSSTSGTQPEAGNPRCQVCDRPRLYSRSTIARGVCATCATHKEETA